MKCPKCDGHGFELLANRFGRIRKLECDLCNGTGYLPTTNEEWLRQCNMEQLAEFLAGIININPCGYLLYCNECGLNDRCCEDDYPSSKESGLSG